jgi:hypothetical protein
MNTHRLIIRFAYLTLAASIVVAESLVFAIAAA